MREDDGCDAYKDRLEAEMGYQHEKQQAIAWAEYDAAAEYLAKRGLKGAEGDALPVGLSALALRFINDDPEAFAERVRGAAYRLARERAEVTA